MSRWQAVTRAIAARYKRARGWRASCVPAARPPRRVTDSPLTCSKAGKQAAIAFNLTRVLARSRRSSRPKLQMMSDLLNPTTTEPAGPPLQGADTS